MLERNTSEIPSLEPTRLNILTFNTANDFITSTDLIRLLENSGADIVGLQELSPRNAAVLEKNLHEFYPHRVAFGQKYYGKALLSRYPLRRHERFVLASGRPYIEAEVEVAGSPVAVLVAHPPPPNHRRFEVESPKAALDVRALLARIRPNHPTLLIGDFNFVRVTPNYRRVRAAGLTDTFLVAGSGPGLTYPTRHEQARLPLPLLVRLDYIWVSRHFRPIASSVGHGYGSDHLPVMSTVELISER